MGWYTLNEMKRVLILGRGAAGKSTLARRLGAITGFPVIELDKIFWRAGLAPTAFEQWAEIQEKLVAEDRWIMDGDLGPYDVIDVRLRSADTVILLDFSLPRCAWRAFRRSRERADFWSWLITYRWRFRPKLMQAIAIHGVGANVYILHDPTELECFVASLSGGRSSK